MSEIVLDTDVASLFYKRRLPAEVERQILGHRTYVAFATAGELRKWTVTGRWGWAKRTAMQLWLEQEIVLPYDIEVAWIWGDIAGRAALRGRTLPHNDLWIASCCIQRGLPLLTMNRRDFVDLERHEGLRLLPTVGDPQDGAEVRSPVPTYVGFSSSERTGGRSAATWSQEAPASWDRYRDPSLVPNAATSPAAARQPVSMLESNHSGSPAVQRSSLEVSSSGARYIAALLPDGPDEALTSTTPSQNPTARQ